MNPSLIFTYFDKTFNQAAQKVLPGGYIAVTPPALLVTLLGSCVTACLRDSSTGICGMNHFMLPDEDKAKDSLMPARYGTQAMELLINDMLKQGANRRHIKAKVFGGGNVLDGLITSNIGRKNALFVKSFLKSEQIEIVASDLEGDYARRIYFFADTGKVIMRKLPSTQVESITIEEQRYRNKIKQEVRREPSGDIDLFI